MSPIGLALKDITTNPFTGRTSGELMIIHRCLRCNHISRNRIAGDDFPDAIIELLKLASPSKILGITFLTLSDLEIVLISIYGFNYEKYWP